MRLSSLFTRTLTRCIEKKCATSNRVRRTASWSIFANCLELVLSGIENDPSQPRMPHARAAKLFCVSVFRNTRSSSKLPKKRMRHICQTRYRYRYLLQELNTQDHAQKKKLDAMFSGKIGRQSASNFTLFWALRLTSTSKACFPCTARMWRKCYGWLPLLYCTVEQTLHRLGWLALHHFRFAKQTAIRFEDCHMSLRQCRCFLQVVVKIDSNPCDHFTTKSTTDTTKRDGSF